LNTVGSGVFALPAAPVISSSIWPRCIWPGQTGRQSRQPAQSSLRDGSRSWRSSLAVGRGMEKCLLTQS
ncbi:hypothetical protein AOLI_G00302780, partial [Acnodon oligacanthus]